MSDIKAVLFDFDGVLCDTGLMHTSALATAIRDILGTDDPTCDMLENKLEAFGTIPSREKLHLLGISPVRFDHIYAQKQRIVLNSDLPPAHSGVLDVLALCDRKNLAMGIVSNTNYAFIARWLRKNLSAMMYGRFFPIITNDWGLKSKPDPEPYRVACEIIGSGPGSTLAIEDSPNGCAAALRAGCKLLHVDNSSQLSREGVQQWV